ncbi:hypothetical protein PVAG01_10439 [Phlyctema vagabunda]|uniref:Uncharacterized protein n=1 Tax=Phlyctema vagabunda TaxID=108571 RepID=A0ABR4P5Z0_9HELO
MLFLNNFSFLMCAFAATVKAAPATTPNRLHSRADLTVYSGVNIRGSPLLELEHVLKCPSIAILMRTRVIGLPLMGQGWAPAPALLVTIVVSLMVVAIMMIRRSIAFVLMGHKRRQNHNFQELSSKLGTSICVLCGFGFELELGSRETNEAFL